MSIAEYWQHYRTNKQAAFAFQSVEEELNGQGGEKQPRQAVIIVSAKGFIHLAPDGSSAETL